MQNRTEKIGSAFLESDFLEHFLFLMIVLVLFVIALRSFTAPYPHVFGDEWAHAMRARKMRYLYGGLGFDVLYIAIYHTAFFFGESFYIVAKLYNLLFFAGFLFIVYLISIKRLSQKLTLFLVLVIAAGPANAYTSVFTQETPLLFFFWLFVWFVLNFTHLREKHSFVYWSGAGFFFALVSMIKARLLLGIFPLTLFIAYTVYARSFPGLFFRRNAKKTFYFVLNLFCFFCVFYTVRFCGEWLVFGKIHFIFLESKHLAAWNKLVAKSPFLDVNSFFSPFFQKTDVASVVSTPSHLPLPTAIPSPPVSALPPVLSSSPTALPSIKPPVLPTVALAPAKAITTPFSAISPLASWVINFVALAKKNLFAMVHEFCAFWESFFVTVCCKAASLEALWKNICTHLKVLCILFGLPIVIAFECFFSRVPCNEPRKKWVKDTSMLLLLFLGVFLCVSSLFSFFRPGENVRLHMRYYNVILPLFALIAAQTFSAISKKDRAKGFFVFFMLVFVLISTFFPFGHFLLQWMDCPEARLLRMTKVSWWGLCGISLFSLVLYLGSKKRALTFYLFVLFPFLGLCALVNPDLYVAGRLPKAVDKAARFLEDNFSSSVSHEVVLYSARSFGVRLDRMLRYDFLTGHYSHMRGKEIRKLDLSTLEKNINWIVVFDGIEVLDDGTKWISWKLPDFSLYGRKRPVFLNFRKKQLSLAPLARIFGVNGITGTSSWDKWENQGVWTSGKKGSITLLYALPEKFYLRILAKAFGPNIGESVEVQVGSQKKNVTFSKLFSEQVVCFEHISGDNKIDFIVPKPVRPSAFFQTLDASGKKDAIQEFNLGDSRALGIQIAEIEVYEPKDMQHPLGKEILFGEQSRRIQYPFYGWSYPEGASRWNDGDRCGIVLNVKDFDPYKPLSLSLKALPFLPFQDMSPRKIGVLVNGKRVATWFMGNLQWYSALLPPSCLGDGLLDISFVVEDDLFSPKEKGLFSDPRQIAFAAEKLVLQQLKEIPPGKVLSFAQGGETLKYCEKGLYPPEKDGSWTQGHKASLCLPLGFDVSSDVAVTLSFQGIYGAEQRLVAKSDTMIVYDEILHGDTREVTFTIPKKSLQHNIANIDLEFPSALSPQELEESSDGRVLAFKMKGLSLSPLELSGDRKLEVDFHRRILCNEKTAFLRYCEFGWGKPEGTYTWTSGHHAGLRFILPKEKISGDALLRVQAFGYLGKSLSAQKVDVFVQGVLLGTWEISKLRWYELRIPEELVKESPLHVVFSIENATSPQEEGLSPDDRLLGIGVKTIIFESVGENEASSTSFLDERGFLF